MGGCSRHDQEQEGPDDADSSEEYDSDYIHDGISPPGEQRKSCLSSESNAMMMVALSNHSISLAITHSSVHSVYHFSLQQPERTFTTTGRVKGQGRQQPATGRNTRCYSYRIAQIQQYWGICKSGRHSQPEQADSRIPVSLIQRRGAAATRKKKFAGR
ncbi:hypothetical protein JB92DRAFT_2836356 [Gautieria morchelliformis]|nr:hypothetical protein JB92DRAFT_2836356 [Gautieria morchelliformis]